MQDHLQQNQKSSQEKEINAQMETKKRQEKAILRCCEGLHNLTRFSANSRSFTEHKYNLIKMTAKPKNKILSLFTHVIPN